MRRKKVKEDVEIIRSGLKKIIISIDGEGRFYPDWRTEERDGRTIEVLTLNEIHNQTRDYRSCTTVIVYDNYEGGAMYRYGDTETHWAKIGDLYPTHA